MSWKGPSVFLLLSIAMGVSNLLLVLIQLDLTTRPQGAYLDLGNYHQPNFESGSHYSWIGHDYPNEFPMEDPGYVAMTLQGSSRMELNVSDPVADEEWNVMLTGVRGFGRPRLGPEMRVVSVSSLEEFWFLIWYLVCCNMVPSASLSSSDSKRTVG